MGLRLRTPRWQENLNDAGGPHLITCVLKGEEHFLAVVRETAALDGLGTLLLVLRCMWLRAKAGERPLNAKGGP